MKNKVGDQMKHPLTIASNNAHKIEEISHKLAPLGFKTLAQSQVLKEALEVEETEKTLEGNARLKAKALWDKVGGWVLADDSGLFVEALDGAPGVHSSRYAGRDHDDAGNNEKLLRELEGQANRRAAFKAVFALISPSGEEHFIYGECPGEILLSAQGDQGFGYDPLFKPEGYKESFAQLGEDVKNEISHRGRAIDELVAFLEASDEARLSK